MAVVSVVDIVGPNPASGTQAGSVPGAAQVVVVAVGGTSPTVTQNLSQSDVAVVQPGGTVANVGWGYTFPPAPVEGQIFIKVTP